MWKIQQQDQGNQGGDRSLGWSQNSFILSSIPSVTIWSSFKVLLVTFMADPTAHVRFDIISMVETWTNSIRWLWAEWRVLPHFSPPPLLLYSEHAVIFPKLLSPFSLLPFFLDWDTTNNILFLSFIFGCTGSLLLFRLFSRSRVGTTLQLQYAGFLLRWLLLLWSTGSRVHALQRFWFPGSKAQAK